VLEKVSTIIKYLQIPTDGDTSSVQLGAIVNPMTDYIVKTQNVDIPAEGLDTCAYWDVSEWDTAYWDQGKELAATTPVEGRGTSFCLYIAANELDVEIYRMFAFIRPEVT